MTVPKKPKFAEIIEKADKLFDNSMLNCDPHNFKRITAAETVFGEYKKIQMDVSIEGLQAKANLLMKACMLNPYFDGYKQPLVTVLARFDSELYGALIGRVDTYIRDLPVAKQIIEYNTPFYQFIDSDAIYLEIEKTNENKAKAREISAEDRLATINSRFSSNVQLMDAVNNWSRNAVAEEPKRRKKQAAEIMNEVKLRKSLPQKQKITQFERAQLEITAAYLDNENKGYTESAKKHLKETKRNFNEEQVEFLVNTLDFMRSRVMESRPFRSGASEMIMLLQPKK